MNRMRRVNIIKVPTAVPGLDEVLGGGLPEFSFNLIAGGPGTGKTTLAHQIMFGAASPERKALYFTVLGEPPLKILRYQQQMSFFDPSRLDGVIHFVNLSQEVLDRDLSHVLDRIVQEVEAASPGIVIVDSFRTVVRASAYVQAGELELQSFVQRLALYLTSWQATTFLVGEYMESELRDNPVFTVADGIIWLFQEAERNSIVRKMQVMKMRGQESMPGLHTFRITSDGIQVFPRLIRGPEVQPGRGPFPPKRISTGVTGLDEMMGGGIPLGDSVLVGGPSGSGKTVLVTQFMAEGIRRGEKAVLAIFEEHPPEYLQRAKSLGFDLEEMVRQGKLKVIYLRPLDLSADETLVEVRQASDSIGASRVVIDSLSGFELALAPPFREDFRESLYRMVGALTGRGVTVWMTVEVTESFTDLHFSPHEVSFLADDIILQRYMELDGQLRKVMTVVKMRSSDHSKDLRAYEITPKGIVTGERLQAYRGVITGVPELRGARALLYPGLTPEETAVLQALIAIDEGTAEEVAQKAGLPLQMIATALQRLVAINYAVRLQEEERTVYRPLARLLGAETPRKGP